MLQKYLVAKRFILFCFAMLLLLFLYWFQSRQSGYNVTILLAQIIPLAVFIPGVMANHYRTYSWICFVLLFYFIKAVEGIFVSTATASDIVFLILTVCMFTASMMASRWAQRLKADHHAETEQEKIK